MANNENLKKLSSEEARKLGSKGGKASVKARRKKKELKQLLEIALSQPSEVPGEDNYMAICASLINEAKTGNSKAFEIIRDTIGQKPTEQTQMDLTAKIEVDYGD